MSILIGCSGWSYEDWVGSFYPRELARRRGEWLAYYARYFSTVEINSTFYRPPGELQVASWVRKGSELRDFQYSLKMPQQVTHEHMVRGRGMAPSGGQQPSREAALSLWPRPGCWAQCSCSSPLLFQR